MICAVCHGLITGRLNRLRRYCDGGCLNKQRAAQRETRRIERQLQQLAQQVKDERQMRRGW